MKNGFWFLSLLVATFIFSACDKDEDENGDNWAVAVEGSYVGTVVNQGNKPTTVLITRIADKQFNLQFSYTSGFIYTFCMDSVVMNTKTTFIINEYDGCDGSVATGGGNFSGNQVDFTVQSRTVTATKQ